MAQMTQMRITPSPRPSPGGRGSSWGFASAIPRSREMSALQEGAHQGRPYICICVICVICGFLFLTSADAYTGRRAILKTSVEVMLAENLPHAKQDCTLAAWRLVCDLWPELRTQKWFHRTTAEAMAGWPWKALMRLEDGQFGDLYFANSNDDIAALKSPKEQFLIKHVLMGYDEPETAVHASSKKGFSKTKLRPFWWPRINLAIRPPY